MLAILVRVGLLAGGVALLLPAQEAVAPRLRLEDAHDARLGAIRRGTFTVFEDRAARAGRTIDLQVLVLRAEADQPLPDPVYVLAGGPGQAATSLAPGLARSWLRRQRDIVLVDQRGTGGSNPLHVPAGHAADGTLAPLIDVEAFRRALPALQQRADLRLYTTPIAIDDLDELRAALGHERIDLVGGSYGTRAALVYMRRHTARVRCAILSGVAPPSLLNPFHHARGAQEAFDALAAECAAEPRYRAAFGDLHDKLRSVLARLAAAPVRVEVPDGRGGTATVELTRDGFAEALRVLLYTTAGNRQVPGFLAAAAGGDFAAFARVAFEHNRGLRDSLAFGMLMCVVGSEDIPRIDPDGIEAATAGTFLGDVRVRAQMEVAAFWPRGEVGEDYAEPLAVDTPTLLLSGTMDPVTPPRFAEEVHRHLRNSLHLVVPGAHEGKDDPCLRGIQERFLATASVAGLDTSCVRTVRLPPLVMPARIVR